MVGLKEFEKPLLICYAESFDLDSFLELKKKIPARIFSLKEALEDEKDLLNQVQIFFIRSRTKINQHLIRKMPSLRLIITTTSGFDHIDFEALRQRKIKVSYTPSIYKESVSELVFLLILSLMRNFFDMISGVKKNLWREDMPRGALLKGKRLGILGLGNIGSYVAMKAKAFGMKVMAFDPYILDEKFKALHVVKKDFKSLLKASDILSLHLPLTDETRHLINQETLGLLSRGSFLINTSRGGVIEEEDLVKILRKRKIAGAGLDVFEKEPLYFKSPLFSYYRENPSNLILTPHIGSYVEEVFKKASREAIHILLEFLKTGVLKNSLLDSLDWWKIKKDLVF